MQGDWIIHHHPKDTHHIPDDDLIDHQADEHCICGPTHRSNLLTGEVWWDVWHASLDGREADE